MAANGMNQDMDMSLGGNTDLRNMKAGLKAGGKKGRAQKMKDSFVETLEPVREVAKQVPMPSTQVLVMAGVIGAVGAMAFFLRPWAMAQLQKRADQQSQDHNANTYGA